MEIIFGTSYLKGGNRLEKGQGDHVQRRCHSDTSR